MRQRVVLGISGGVDSAVSALLLQQAGYEVIGLFMHNWEEQDEQGNCTSEQDFSDAKGVCTSLGIPYYSLNFAKQYRERVFAYFLDEYKKGRTPNPDVLCNREIKFGPFSDYAMTLGADYIATGHYCKVEREGGVTRLVKAKDADKDQTYFLCQLSQKQLERVIFPLADLTKKQVREIAAVNNLCVAEKKDSTGICFIGERNFRNFLLNYLPAQEGDIVDTQGNVVGRHIGLMFYTIGQRKGLGIGGVKGLGEGRWFVLDKDLANNKLIVSHSDQSPLYDSGCIVSQFNWIADSYQEGSKFDCFVKLRYRQQEQATTVTVLPKGQLRLDFDKKQRAVTCGQFAVLYSGIYCLGGGVIDEIIK